MSNLNRENLLYRKATLAFIFNSKGELLIIHKVSYKPENWGVPGGGLEENETAQQAITRELQEEVGFENQTLLYKSRHSYQYEWPDLEITKFQQHNGKMLRGQSLVQFVFSFNPEDNKINLQKEEIDDYKWINIKDLEKYILFPGARANVKLILAEYREYLRIK